MTLYSKAFISTVKSFAFKEAVGAANNRNIFNCDLENRSRN